jgi:cyclase
LNRRRFLQTALSAGSAALIQPRQTPGRTPSALASVSLGGGLAQITGAGGNVVTFTSSDGVVMVDGGLAAHTPELLKLALGGTADASRVAVLFNTHWHWDHTGANDALGTAGTKIVAHENTKLWLGGDFYVEWEDRHYKPRKREALPTHTFYKKEQMSFGGEQIEYGHLPRAHTDGDIYVFFRNANVLVAGDLLAVGTYPVLDYSTGGWLGGLIEANAAMLKLVDSNTRIVPGKGPVQTREDLEAQHDMLSEIKSRMEKMIVKGMSPDDMLAAGATRGFDEKCGDPKLFVHNAYRGLWAHAYLLGIGII